MQLTAVFPVPPRRWLRMFGSGLARTTRDERQARDGSGERAGEPPAINQLYHARRLGLVRLAVLMVDDLPTAEDIVQDVFAALYKRHGGGLSSVADPDAYLTAGVLNAARSALRRRRTARAYLPPPPGAVPAAEDQVLGREDREVLDALKQLTVRQRQVVVLRYWSGLSELEIAETLRVSRGTVKSTANRALTVLRDLLGERR
ncbi:RNA polymerase sigma factor [Actinoplanes sp. N902-109]|uniref:RNA polymerase sigma factor n=1 Tax=Actinoplanes sp. (strain N902-109) TaxID=649831 RepID=UPI00032954D1|nr:sigma-70 family RNA polymerase sigma factor [Actinoplanes sp. N902-109]AGL15664.1 RNA polymerase sigma factor, sigma-70 family/RNA polymerase sigma-70 factor, sigma-E family [Actinoplanes sp. N902-109]